MQLQSEFSLDRSSGVPAQAGPSIDVAAVIHRIVADRAINARFANTLSLLEYMGARKILKSQRSETVTDRTLAHAAEEIRHSQLLKRLALLLSDGDLKSYRQEHLLAGAQAKEYFQSIDLSAAQAIGAPDPKLNYLLTTLLIEERATALYPIYERELTRAGVPNSLIALIQEEDSHLREVRQLIGENQSLEPQALDELRTQETAGFENYLRNTIDNFN